MSKEVEVVSTDVKELAFPEITKLQMEDSFNKLVAIMPEHKGMIEVINTSLPEIHRSTSLFFKTQSQFMDNLLTVSHNTPLRNLRQILAEMNKTREAIKEAYFKLKKKDVELKQKQREYLKLFKDGIIENGLINEENDLIADLLEIEVQEIISNAESTRGYISGAIRKLANYTAQYNSIVEKHGLGEFNEADFEKEEERYHIMKAFEQGLSAARSHHGMIDEGNQIYLAQIGINGATAQYYVTEFLQAEQKLLAEGKAPTHKAYLDFLERMANTFQGSADAYAEAKGMTAVSPVALIQQGDTRFLPKPDQTNQ